MFHSSVSVQVDAYEAQKQELIAENTDLRNMLRSMQGDMNELNISLGLELPHTHLGGNSVATVQDIFDLPLHMARDQIEQSLQAGMTSIKVYFQFSSPFQCTANT
jgi:X breakpoint 2-interacting protein